MHLWSWGVHLRSKEINFRSRDVNLRGKFLRSYLAGNVHWLINSMKWLSISPLDPDASIFKSPTTKILSYLFIAWLIVFDISWETTFLSYSYHIMHHLLLDIKGSMQVISVDLVSKCFSLLSSNSFLIKTIFPPPSLFTSLLKGGNW